MCIIYSQCIGYVGTNYIHRCCVRIYTYSIRKKKLQLQLLQVLTPTTVTKIASLLLITLTLVFFTHPGTLHCFCFPLQQLHCFITLLVKIFVHSHSRLLFPTSTSLMALHWVCCCCFSFVQNAFSGVCQNRFIFSPKGPLVQTIAPTQLHIHMRVCTHTYTYI